MTQAGLGFDLCPAPVDVSFQFQWPHSPSRSINLGPPRELWPETLRAKNEEMDFAIVSNQKFPCLDQVFPWRDASTEKNGQTWDLRWSMTR